jgi:hypothetical protein
MRTIVTLILSILAITTNATTTYRKLCELNKVWLEQDIAAINLPQYTNLDEQQWIQLHLSLVEQTLRAKDITRLTPNQQHNRIKALDYLHNYWQAGAFPLNEDYRYRTPIFIDKHDNFCAVGYLVKATGYEHVARKISALTNLAYVRDMRYEDLFTWANEYGFTIDELAWIQPNYALPVYSLPVGKGFSGSVNELYVDPSEQNLYVGGIFTNNSKSNICYNVARVTNVSGFEWHNMGTGVNGKVNAIAQLGTDVFAAGDFTLAGGVMVNNIARWDGVNWNAAGCFTGIVKDMVVYNGRLYACGNFTICPNTTAVSFAVWTGTGWQPIPGVVGTVNTMEVVNSDLFLGGNFNHFSLQVNAVKWNDVTGFSLFGNPIQNEVNDFTQNRGALYAFCKHTSSNDSGLIHRYDSNGFWSTTYKSEFNGLATINTACDYWGYLKMGGEFNTNVRCSIKNTVSTTANASYLNCHYSGTQINLLLDSTVHKATAFKGHLIWGGDFTTGICREIMYDYVQVYTDFVLNNCDGSNGNVSASVAGETQPSIYRSGFPPYRYLWSTGDTTKVVSNLPAGMYTVVVTDSLGDKDTSTVSIGPVDFNILSLDTIDSTLWAYNYGIKNIWIDCSTGLTLQESSGWAGYKPITSGNYAAIVTLHGCTDTTNCIYVEVPTNSVTGVPIEQAVLYPNPVTDVLHISFASTQEKLSITICDLAGRVILRQSEQDRSRISIDLSNLPQGMYTTTVTYADDTTTVHKIVKQ